MRPESYTFTAQDPNATVVIFTRMSRSGIEPALHFWPIDLQTDRLSPEGAKPDTAFSFGRGIPAINLNFSSLNVGWQPVVLNITPGAYVLAYAQLPGEQGIATTFQTGSLAFEARAGEVTYVGHLTISDVDPETGEENDFGRARYDISLSSDRGAARTLLNTYVGINAPLVMAEHVIEPFSGNILLRCPQSVINFSANACAYTGNITLDGM